VIRYTRGFRRLQFSQEGRFANRPYDIPEIDTMNACSRSRRPLVARVALVAAILAVTPIAADERIDYDALFRIKEEGLQRSQVMETLSYLTDVHGPRLTGSPNIRAAAEWTKTRLAEWGITNAKLEPWGPFGHGWTNERVSVHVIQERGPTPAWVAPQSYPVIAYPKAWTPGTEGPVTADAILAVLETEKDFEKFRGQLKGKFVLTQQVRELKALFDPPGQRFTDKALTDLAQQPEAGAQQRRRFDPERLEFLKKLSAFLNAEQPAGVIEPGRGDGGTVFVQGGGSRDPKDPPARLQLVFAAEHYNRIVRTLQKKIPVKLEVDVRNRFHNAELNAFNVIAEIPGTDKSDEIVMIGAHFDSWHGGTGATDNAAGSAVMLEAMRILKAAGLKPRRTVRLALWTGEEQGLLGSRAYVKDHFADRTTMALKPGHARLSAYFNVDNGTGAIRGVYLQGNEAAAPIFRDWMEPLRNLGMTTLTIRNTSGTDHLSFDGVGLPGFQFIQDPVEYDTRTHHSNMDVYDRVQAADMMKNAVIVAAFTYNAAMRAEKLPRKPLPKPQPAQPSGARPTTASP
jgi:carboxypeptidase Q